MHALLQPSNAHLGRRPGQLALQLLHMLLSHSGLAVSWSGC